MALSFPEAPALAWMTRFTVGLRVAQVRFGCHLIGGDTDRRPGPLTISITVIGSVPQGGMVRRRTAKPGDVLFVSGTLGDAALGAVLRKGASLAKAWNLTPEEDGHLRRRYLRPEPRLALASALRAHAAAAMDISDGLAKDLGRMCRASGCGASIRFKDVPVSTAAGKAVPPIPDCARTLSPEGTTTRSWRPCRRRKPRPSRPPPAKLQSRGAHRPGHHGW